MLSCSSGTIHCTPSIVNRQLHVFQHGHRPKRTHDLVCAGHTFFHKRGGSDPGDVLAAQRDFAATWFVSSCDYAEQGGFSGAVRPDKAADLLYRNIKAHVLQGGYAPKVLCQALYLQNRHVFS